MEDITKEQFVNAAGQFFQKMIKQDMRITQLQAENKKLKKALKRYGRHIDCDSNAILVESKGKGKGWYSAPCSCGFEHALKGG